MKKELCGVTKGLDVLCKCGGQVMVHGTGYKQLPVGFGFHNDGKFHIDSVKIPGYFGVCLKCMNKVFAPKGKQTLKTKTLDLGTRRPAKKSALEIILS